MPVCNILFCPPGVSLLLRTSIYTNLKMILYTPDQAKKKGGGRERERERRRRRQL
jgi:accessory gene regulator protein AgrB